MKRTIAVIPAAVLILSLCACGKLSYNSSSSLDGVTAEIENVRTKVNKRNSTLFDTEIKITNGSEKEVMKVDYDLTVFDKAGNELHTFKFSYMDPEQSLKPGENAVDKCGFQQVLEGKPSKVTVAVTKIHGIDEISPVKFPEKGEYLYKSLNDDNLANIDASLPSAVFIRIDQGGYERVADLREEEDIRKAVDLFTEIKIGNETGVAVTDNYNFVGFTFADGTEKGISLNLKNLEVVFNSEYRIYELDDFDEFWSFAESVVVEVK